MSKTSNNQKVQCIKEWLNDFKKNIKYAQKPKMSDEVLYDLKTQYVSK